VQGALGELGEEYTGTLSTVLPTSCESVFQNRKLKAKSLKGIGV
jgi:hypothetical protein